MIEKCCIFIFLLTTWNTLTSSKKATHHLQFWLGCQILMPCRPLSINSDSFKWFYKKDGQSTKIQLYVLDKRGMSYYGSGRRINKTHNRSLIIDNFMEEDQGVYWCENCHKDICRGEQPNVFSVQKETLKEIQKTFHITAGSNFTQTCSGGFPDLKWTFEASKKAAHESKLRPGTVVETTIYIVNVKSTDAGKYTCWASRCGGPSQKLLTVNLCVIEVHRTENSSLFCATICDEGFNTSKNTSHLLINNATISVDVDPSGSLICNATNILDERTAGTSSYTSSAVLNTSGNSEGTEYMFPVIWGVSTATACLILIALIIFCSKSRLQAGHEMSYFISQEEEERSVIYSSVVIKTLPEKRNTYTTEAECVYSELKGRGNTSG